MLVSKASCFCNFCAEPHPKGAHPRKWMTLGRQSSSWELLAVVLLPVLWRPLLGPGVLLRLVAPARMFSAASLSNASMRLSIFSTFAAVVMIFSLSWSKSLFFAEPASCMAAKRSSFMVQCCLSTSWLWSL